jgi:hypothetical protein
LANGLPIHGEHFIFNTAVDIPPTVIMVVHAKAVLLRLPPMIRKRVISCSE